MARAFIPRHYNKKTKKRAPIYEQSQHLSIFVPKKWKQSILYLK
ncbi:hypothetical protein HMPREF2531_04684 [Bacteroides intestinalis]|uniref:Uncharacterized protein n=1 Tax=Bacteroides intestinalis TaxID=329854 RepID=A0A139KTY7_9BACE|nr:hypothetical protein HMPREF2531_04684 [Bacteroides intestinalis]